MSLGRTRWALGAVASEYKDAEFGDARLGARLTRIANAADARASLGFPQLVDSDGDLEALYRFLSNERITPKAVLEPHVAATVSRAVGEVTCLVVHDTTEFCFGGVVDRKGLGRTGTSKAGFLAHTSLAVSCDGTRVPLGVLALENFARTGTKKPKRPPFARRADLTRESLRWTRQLLHVEALRGDKFEAIHVMDREADIYELMATAVQKGARFVIRAAHDRVVDADADGSETAKLFELARQAPARITREIELSERAAGMNPTVRKRHPKRRARLATVAIGGNEVVPRVNRR